MDAAMTNLDWFRSLDPAGLVSEFGEGAFCDRILRPCRKDKDCNRCILEWFDEPYREDWQEVGGNG